MCCPFLRHTAVHVCTFRVVYGRVKKLRIGEGLMGTWWFGNGFDAAGVTGSVRVPRYMIHGGLVWVLFYNLDPRRCIRVRAVFRRRRYRPPGGAAAHGRAGRFNRCAGSFHFQRRRYRRRSWQPLVVCRVISWRWMQLRLQAGIRVILAVINVRWVWQRRRCQRVRSNDLGE